MERKTSDQGKRKQRERNGMGSSGVAAEATRDLLLAEPPHSKPSNIIFYTDNAGSISRIFDRAPGKAQAHLRAFRRMIRKILKEQDNIRIAISWCPGHSGISGNDTADALTKSGAHLTLSNPEHETQAFCHDW